MLLVTFVLVARNGNAQILVFRFNKALFESTCHTLLCLASVSWTSCKGKCFLPVSIFPNVQQINIFQSHRRLDLLLDLLILLFCRKFSFSEHVLMNALSFRWYISYLNTFFNFLNLPKGNVLTANTYGPPGKTIVPAWMVMSGLSAIWRSWLMNHSETVSSINSRLQIIRDN